MKTTLQALKDGFELKGKNPGYWSFKFGDSDQYELCFEPLIWNEQMYVALYKNEELLTEKIVVKPGYIKDKNE